MDGSGAFKHRRKGCHCERAFDCRHAKLLRMAVATELKRRTQIAEGLMFTPIRLWLSRGMLAV